MTNVEAAQKGRREALVALRDTLAAAVDDASPNMLPNIVGQYRACLLELDEMPGAAEESEFQKARRLRDERRLKAV